MKKWLKILLIVVASVVVLLALALTLLSPVAKSYVNKHGKELIGRELHVDRLRVNALGGRVRIYNLTVYEDDDTTAFFAFDTLDVSVKLRKLLAKELFVRHITLAHPQVRIVQDGSHFNFNSLIDHFASDDTVPDTDTTPSQWRLGFYNIRLSDGEVLYSDLKLNDDWDLNNLNLKVPGVYFDGSENTDAGLTLQLADGGVLRTEASLNMDNNDFAVKLELEKFAISNVKAYLADVMNVSRLDGVLDAVVSVNGNLSDIMKMFIDGKVDINGVDLRDSRGAQVAAFSHLGVDVGGIRLDDNSYNIKSLQLDGLQTHFDIYKDGNNFSRLFATKSEGDAEASAEEELPELAENGEKRESKPLKLSVGSLAINDAQFTYNDYTLPDAFSFPVRKISVKAVNLKTGGDNNARVFAQLPHGGTAAIIWRGNIDNWKQHQSLIFNIKNIQLADLSPYSVAYLGVPFTDGTFSFTSENNIRSSQLDGRNKVDLFNPEVGEKRKDVDPQVKIPLKAALYILKDKDGKVEIDVPVAGNIDSPEFSYMKVVWKTLGNLIVKVATSPFRAAAKAMGTAGELDQIAFNPLQVQFTSEQYNILNKVVAVLQYDTNIVLDLEPQIDMEHSHKQQSLYLLKEEYYMMRHPDKAASDIPPQTFLFDQIDAITLKDSGFVSFVRSKGITAKRPSDKEVQRLAERLYPREAAESSLELLAGYRNEALRRFFDQQGISERQITISQLNTDALKSGYVINSMVIGDEGLPGPEDENVDL